MKTLMLISVLFMAGIQNVAAQINITVTWDKELCNDTCFTQQDCEYYVCFQLWDNCGERPVLLCQDCKSVDCSMEEANFTCPDCENVSNEECYTLVGAVQKRCIGLGGTIVTCTGTGHQDTPALILWNMVEQLKPHGINVILSPVINKAGDNHNIA